MHVCSVKYAKVKWNPCHDFLFNFKLYNDIKNVWMDLNVWMDGKKIVFNIVQQNTQHVFMLSESCFNKFPVILSFF